MAGSILRKLNSTAAVLVFVGIVIAANALLAGVRWRIDLTQDKLYSLSGGTREVLGQLNRDVTLKFYASRSADAVPIMLKQYAQRVQELLEEYEASGKGRVAVETFDPQPDSDEEEWAQRYGVASQPLGMMGEGTSVYLGLVAVSGAKEAVIPFLSPEQEPQLEYQVTRLITEVTQTRKPTIGVMTALPVMGSPGMPYGGMPRTAPWLFVSELKRMYDVQLVPPASGAVATNIDTLLVIQPANMPESARYVVDQFVLRGGRLVAFVDPLCIADQETSGDMFGSQQKDLSPFVASMKTWGLDFAPGKVVADLKYATRIMNERRVPMRNVAWLSLTGDAVASNEVATSSLESLLLVGSGVITGKPAEGLTMTTLLQTSDQAGLVDAMTARLSEDGGVTELVADPSRLPLAVRLQGTFHTAFPLGRPAPASGEEANPPSAEPHRTDGDGVVVLVADADLLYNRFSARSMNFLGQEFWEPLNDNLNFVVNLIEQVSGNPALIGLRSRGSFHRPFTRVQEMERAAAARWREEEKALQEKLATTQQRLGELQQRKDPKQQYILSPEQKAEIEQFRKVQFETRAALKEVRKNLRRDIDRLGLQLKVLNMAAVPALVGLLGLAIGLRRSRG
jgi:ABC-type uncharacterized transport system involved in gliding motility auxiliary subunit